MKRYTPYIIKDKHEIISFNPPILTIGSCFSDSIGKKIEDCQFILLKNPLGSLYHPIIIFKHLYNALNDNPLAFLEGKFLENNEYYLNYQCHSSVFGKNIEDYQSVYTQKIQDIKNIFKQNGLIIITLGSAWAYHLEADRKASSNQNIVGNCHKQNASLFTRQLTEIQEIVKSFNFLNMRLNQMGYQPQFIFTLSPVRHLKDGFEGNSLSKSYCRMAIDEICKNYEQCFYFPAFEILMDELRDYRYYDNDLLHPSTFAEEIIWNYFLDTYVGEKVRNVIIQWQKIQSSMNHRPLFPSSNYSEFLTKIQQKLDFFKDYFDISPFVKKLEKRKTE